MTETVPQLLPQLDAPRRTSGLGFFVSMVCFVDLYLVLSWRSGSIDATQAVTIHSALVVFTSLFSLISRDGNSAHRLVAGALMLLLGPLGGPAILATLLVSRADLPTWIKARQDNCRSQDMDRSRSSELFQQIQQGRRLSEAGVVKESFSWTFRFEDTQRQQAAIAAISKNYVSEMLPSLEIALRSPNAALRVQAAAVFGRLRANFTDRADALLQAIDQNRADVDTALMATEARTVAASGFMTDETKLVLLAAAQRWERLGKVRTRHQLPTHARPQTAQSLMSSPPNIKRYSCGGVA